MSLTQTFRTDTFDAWRINTNTISSNLGDIATIVVGIVNRSTVVAALNDLSSYIGTAALTTVASDLRGAVNEIKGSTLTFAGAKTFSGAVQINNTLGVTGAATLAGLTATTGSFSSTLAATGDLTVNTNKFIVLAASGNTTVAGTLGVTGAATLSTASTSGLATLNSASVTNALSVGTTLGVTGTATMATVNGTIGSFSSTLSATGNLTINTNKFIVTAASGNTAVAGTLAAVGDFTINTNKFIVLAASGNTTVAGTLGVTGASTFSSGSFSTTLSATGDLTVNTNKFIVTAASGNTAVTGTLGVTGASTFTSGAFSTTLGATGAVTFGSTLGVAGTSTLAAVNATAGAFSSALSAAGDFAVNTNKFNVTAASGNTSAAGTLSVTGTSTLAAVNATNIAASGTLGVTGLATLSGVSIFATTLNDASLVVRVTNSNAAFSGAPNRFTIDTAGNVVVNGNLSVAGSTSLSGTVTTNVDWSSITNKPSPVVAVTLTGPITGSGSATLTSLAGGTYTASFATTITAASVTLGTHTTGNYVATAVAGSGIGVSGATGNVTITNSDRGSSQFVFKAIAVSGQTNITTTTNTDTLTFAAGSNVTITTTPGTKTVTIAASVVTPNDPTVTITAGTGLSGGGSFTLNQVGTGSVTLTNSDLGSSQSIFKSIATAGSTSLAAASNTDTLTLIAGQVSATQGIAISLNTTAGQNAVISHFDTSTVANSSNTLGTVIQSLSFDTYGHVLTLGTANLDSRYLQSYTETSTLNDVTTRGATTANSITVGALVVSGSGNANIGGNLTVTGNLTINGSTTTVNATTISVSDPVITLGGTVAPGSDDGKDRGVEARYYSTVAKVGWFGRRNSNGRFAYINDATNTSEVFSGTLGNIEATTFFGALTGNATTATTLATPRNINGVAFDGSGNITIAASTTNTLTIGTGLAGTSFNGSAAVTIALAASGVGGGGTTGSTTVIPIVTYDTYGRITSISGSASIAANTAVTLATPRTINGVSFNGSANITIAASTTNALTIGTLLTGTSFDGSGAVTIAHAVSGVGVGSSVGSTTLIPVITYDTYGHITAVSTAAVPNGSLTLAVSGTGLSGSASFTANQAGASTFTVTSNATSANTASAIVARDGSGNFSAGTITATLSGNATNISAFTINQSVGTANTPSFTGISSTAQSNFQGGQASAMATATANLGGIMVQGNGTNAAFMSFHRPSSYASYFGLDTDNKWKVGGWSAGAVAYELLNANNYTSFAPTLTGSGASGTWGIAISGNAATATTASSANAVAWTNVSGRPTNVSSFTNDSGYYSSGSAASFSSVTATGNIIAYFSDERLKDVYGPITGALSKVNQLNGFYFKGNAKAAALGYDISKFQVGVSAQAVESVLPEIIQDLAGLDENGKPYKTVDYAKLTPLLIEAIKELTKRVEQLEAR